MEKPAGIIHTELQMMYLKNVYMYLEMQNY